MTIKKKIAAIAAAAMMAMSITAISASADQPTHKLYSADVNGSTAYAELNADVSEKVQFATTTYDILNDDHKSEVRVNLHVDNYYTGKLIDDDKDDSKGYYPVAQAVCYVTDTPISLFSAHEVYPNGATGWGHYLDLHGIVQ